MAKLLPYLLLLACICRAQEPTTAYSRQCSVCHGADASGSDRGPALTGNRRMRTRSTADIAGIIRNGTPGGMPPFKLAESEVNALAEFVKSLNQTAFESAPQGDAAAGEQFFFGQGKCGACHMVKGRGGSNGPDLSSIGRQLTLPELRQSLTEPSARIAPGYSTAVVTLSDNRVLRGFLRSQGSHDLQLQTADGKLHLLTDRQYKQVKIEAVSLMPAAKPSGDLIAYLSRLDGVTAGALTSPIAAPVSEFEAILHPKQGEWPTYNGDIGGNRYSTLAQINTTNIAKLQPQWIFPIAYSPLETTPLVSEGVMYVTGPNQVYAVDARTGRAIWSYSRPRTEEQNVAGDARLGANRGVALSGNRVFFNTDDNHMLSLNRLTGALMWDVYMPENINDPQHYGATTAPLVVNDVVISGVAGGDQGIRGFVGAWKITTGELVWRFWTVPKPGEPGSETWQGTDTEGRGGGTWLTGTYDPETGLLYWPTGNPFPDTDGSQRIGDNLYSNCVVALDPKTGKLRWHFQFTPHDIHDWDSVQTPVLVDAKFKGVERKLLLHADRNGFYYVLDRTNGQFLLGEKFVKKATWASGIDKNGRPLLTSNNEVPPTGTKSCPAVRGATNWYSPAYSPLTNLYYVMVVEDCGSYSQSRIGGFGFLNNPKDPGMKYLRALDMETGAIKWEIPQIGPVEKNYSGVLATAGGLVFYGETSGGFAAVDQKSGKTLWHFEAGATWKGSPMTYTVDGRQYVAIASGANVLSFALPVQ